MLQMRTCFVLFVVPVVPAFHVERLCKPLIAVDALVNNLGPSVADIDRQRVSRVRSS
jgi:hypothetical protein